MLKRASTALIVFVIWCLIGFATAAKCPVSIGPLDFGKILDVWSGRCEFLKKEADEKTKRLTMPLPQMPEGYSTNSTYKPPTKPPPIDLQPKYPNKPSA